MKAIRERAKDKIYQEQSYYIFTLEVSNIPSSATSNKSQLPLFDLRQPTVEHKK